MRIATSIADLQVLLVEPSTMQAHLVTQMLQRLGTVGVRRCSAAAEALQAMHALQPSVVISSLYLPDRPGTELVAAMRAEPELESLPFILISSETRPQMLEPIRQSGACCILHKPFSEAQLARALNGAVEALNPAPSLDGVEVESLKVLLVDDSLASRRHLRRMLDELGIEHIIEAENGVQAVHALDATMVDLVITDYNMPEMDGRALTEFIRTRSWQNRVPILMVTSEHDQGRLAAVERAGVSAVCDKPFESGSIRRLILAALAD
ncbi:MAG: hypothetical protein RIR00_1212 [Pseudomonadota bacterium]|jgi:two-component system chemotaxis response regulator CheY